MFLSYILEYSISFKKNMHCETTTKRNVILTEVEIYVTQIVVKAYLIKLMNTVK